MGGAGAYLLSFPLSGCMVCRYQIIVVVFLARSFSFSMVYSLVTPQRVGGSQTWAYTLVGEDGFDGHDGMHGPLHGVCCMTNDSDGINDDLSPNAGRRIVQVVEVRLCDMLVTYFVELALRDVLPRVRWL